MSDQALYLTGNIALSSLNHVILLMKLYMLPILFLCCLHVGLVPDDLNVYNKLCAHSQLHMGP